MKIYLLPVPEKLLPAHGTLIYPPHNRDYGVEQDFLEYLRRHPERLTDSPDAADWHYLPVYWGRWHIAHDYAATGREELQEAVDASLINDAKTFTVVSYSSGPLIDTRRIVRFQSSRRDEYGIDIPLVCTRHRKPLFRPHKKFSGGFIGRVFTHPVRKEMFEVLKARSDVYLYDGEDVPSKAYARNLLESWLALSPRGYGGTSYRFFEAMQLGTVPLLIGDMDIRPFKQFIRWEDYSLYLPSTEGLNELLDTLDHAALIAMGKRAQKLYDEQLDYQKWCPTVFKELANR